MIDIQTDRQTDRQMDIWTERQSDRQIPDHDEVLELNYVLLSILVTITT